MSRFRLVGISSEPFESLFGWSDEKLRTVNAVRVIADADFGYPCRVSLTDAEIDDEMLLLPYQHQPAPSPYRASGPIFVRRNATRRVLDVGEIPPYISRRLISLRAYDDAHHIVSADVCEGIEIAAQLDSLFSDDVVRYAHLHNARRGCFACLADRA
jgi:hypothetical protein